MQPPCASERGKPFRTKRINDGVTSCLSHCRFADHKQEGLILGRQGNWGGNLAYGFAHLGKSLFWYSSELLFAYFLTEFVHLAPLQMGAVLAAGFVASALIDVATGTVFRHALADPGSASRLQFVGSILCSASLVLVFAGAWLPFEWRFAYSILAGLAFRLSFALYDLPQNALMALATRDAPDRRHLASTRIWFSGTATLIVALAVGPLVAAQRSATGPDFLFWLAGSIAVTAITGAWLLSRLLRHAVRPAAGKAESKPAGARMQQAFPPAFWLLLLVMLATSLFTPLFSKLEPYFATYVLRSPWWGGAVVIAMAAGIVAGQPFWGRMCHRFSYGAVMAGNALLQVLALAVFALAGGANPQWATLAAFVFGLGNGGVGMVQWAAFSETVAGVGPGRTGVSYGLFSGTSKLAFAVGGLLLGLTLARIDLEGGGAAMLVPLMVALTGLGSLCVGACGLILLRRECSMPGAASKAGA